MKTLEEKKQELGNNIRQIRLGLEKIRVEELAKFLACVPSDCKPSLESHRVAIDSVYPIVVRPQCESATYSVQTPLVASEELFFLATCIRNRLNYRYH